MNLREEVSVTGGDGRQHVDRIGLRGRERWNRSGHSVTFVATWDAQETGDSPTSPTCITAVPMWTKGGRRMKRKARQGHREPLESSGFQGIPCLRFNDKIT